MSNLGEQLRKIAENKKASLESIVRKTVLDMSANMMEISPVDTGRFRSNWQYGVDAINADTSRAPDQSGSEALESIRSGIASWKPGETIFVTNSLPYAQRLENGWSQQAPAGMVRVTLANFQEHFARALGEAKA